ncbi:MAG: hypothetical protein HUU02_16595 [Bacteroidetes bacterium]|nr:hypothetical protein [Bacteroidota bacterium]
MRIFIILLAVSIPCLGQESVHGPLQHACTDCHTTEGWTALRSSAAFDHSTTAFVLYGQHRTTDCRQCHTNLRFRGTPSQCLLCHRQEYDKAVTVDHRKNGFSGDCQECHNAGAATWRSGFDHKKTQFPTTGIHEAVPCVDCHTNGRYAGTPNTCVACHREEYVAAKNPDHITARFPEECAQCHRALTWKPATFFPHEQYFPIGAGAKHRPGRWNECTDCHTAAPNYATFECINCHEHGKQEMDSEHRGENGYLYQSTACYRCHPSGDGD